MSSLAATSSSPPRRPFYRLRCGVVDPSVFWVVCYFCLLTAVRGQPYVYPQPNSAANAFVYDRSRGILTRHPGGLAAFFCEDCSESPVVFTTEDRLEVLISWLGSADAVVRFQDDVSVFSGGTRLRVIEYSRTPVYAVQVSIELRGRSSGTVVSVVSGNWTHSVGFAKDVTPPRAQIQFFDESDRETVHQYVIYVRFSEGVVWNAAPPPCPEIRSVDRPGSNATEMLRLSESCTEDLLASSILDGVRVLGATRYRTLLINEWSEFYVVAETESKNKTQDIEIRVGANFTDFAGNALEAPTRRIFYYRPFPPPARRQHRLLRKEVAFPVKSFFSGKVVGQAATVAVAGASAASFASSSASGGSGGGASITMLNNVQKLHMTGMLAVARMPGSYKNFTGEMNWAVLDVKTPWERSNKRNATSNDNANVTGQRRLRVVDASLELQDDESALDYFQRIMFWIPVIFLVVIALHLIILAYFLIKEKPLPDILQMPRIELMLAYFALPPVAIAAAGLYTSSRANALIGTWVLVAVPCHFLAWNCYMLWIYVLGQPPHQREVNVVMDIPNRKQRALRRLRRMFTRESPKVHGTNARNRSSLESLHGYNSRGQSSRGASSTVELVPAAQSSGDAHQGVMHRAAVEEGGTAEQEPLTCREILETISNMGLLALLFGAHQDEGEWVPTKTQGSKFSARYGPLFEEHRGPAIGRRNVTLEVDPVTGRVDRGELVILRERPILLIPFVTRVNDRFSLQWRKVYRYHLQISTKLLDISKTILVGCIVAGVGSEDDNVYSIVALIGLSLTIIFLMRISRPFPSRLDMLMLLLSEVADLIVYTCALFLILGPATDEETANDIGLALLMSEAFALAAMIMEYFLLSIGFAVLGYEEWQDLKLQHRFFEVAHKVLMRNETYLQKKYVDRWMVRVLGRGFNGRIPQTHEMPWRLAVRQSLRAAAEGLRRMQHECREIWNDGRHQIQMFKQRSVLRGPPSRLMRRD